MCNDRDIRYSHAVDVIEAGDHGEDAFETLLDLAREGYVYAMNYVANCYAAGVAVQKDLPEALRWWRKGATAGDTACMLNIATEYRDRLGNVRRAKWWLNRAAAAGDADAMLEIAETYYKIDKLKHKAKICRLLSSALTSDDFLSEDSQNRIEAIRLDLATK